MDCGLVSLDGGSIGKKEGTVLNIPLNTNDSLFAELADQNISTVPKFLKEKSLEIQSRLRLSLPE